MNWTQITLTASTEKEVQLFSDALAAQGAVSVTLLDAGDQDILEPLPGENPLWHQTRVVGLFDEEARIVQVVKKLQTLTPYVNIDSFADKDWVREWMQYFKPIAFGSRLWICPSGYAPPDPSAINIVLDPGLAFGTGTHPTTALCLEWLAEHCKPGQTVLDYGCGSGILAIAAKKLGAAVVLAVDYDPQAIQATKDNAHRNGLSDADIQVFLPKECPDIQADIVIANIIAGPLVELAPILTKHLKPSGMLVLSGLLTEQAALVQNAYPRIRFGGITEKENWLILAGQPL